MKISTAIRYRYSSVIPVPSRFRSTVIVAGSTTTSAVGRHLRVWTDTAEEQRGRKRPADEICRSFWGRRAPEAACAHGLLVPGALPLLELCRCGWEASLTVLRQLGRARRPQTFCGASSVIKCRPTSTISSAPEGCAFVENAATTHGRDCSKPRLTHHDAVSSPSTSSKECSAECGRKNRWIHGPRSHRQPTCATDSGTRNDPCPSLRAFQWQSDL